MVNVGDGNPLPGELFRYFDCLAELHTSHGVRVESARIDATDEAGMVRVEAVLARG